MVSEFAISANSSQEMENDLCRAFAGHLAFSVFGITFAPTRSSSRFLMPMRALLCGLFLGAIFASAKPSRAAEGAPPPLWIFTATEAIGNPTFGANGEIYVVADRGLVALTTNGTIRWR